jgi:hemin uptake protein HemP
MSCSQQPSESASSSPCAEANPSPESLAPPSVNSTELLHGHRELLIHHEGEVYRLRLTKTGKLILNK